MKGTTFRWHYWIISFFVLDTMEAFGFISRMIYGTWSGKTGDAITQTLNLLMIAASLTLFSNSLQRKSGFAVGSVLAFSAVGFLCLSWSLVVGPATTFRGRHHLPIVILGVIGIARSMDADEYMHLLSWCCFLSAIVSIILLIASPGNAYHRSDGDFLGIFPHKNFLGQVMATGTLATLHGIRINKGGYLSKLCILLILVGDDLRIEVH